MAVPILTGLDNLGQQLARLDYEANRARTGNANTLRELAAMLANQRRDLSENLGTSGMIHSGANVRAQTAMQEEFDTMQAMQNQQLADRLANIARQKIAAENRFNIQRLMPNS